MARRLLACAASLIALVPRAAAAHDPDPTKPSDAAPVEDVHVQGDPAASRTNAASDSTTEQEELSLRPALPRRGRARVVPGLFSVQHAGGGKAQQYFMRGFDLDHGTDLAFFVDGVPVNAVSHAHGQGFSDLHFLIPETIETDRLDQGPVLGAASATSGPPAR